MNDREWPEGSLQERVQFALEEVRPALRADGGDAQLVAIERAIVKIRLRGACKNCPMAQSTLQDFVAERIKLYAPEITEVVALAD